MIKKKRSAFITIALTLLVSIICGVILFFVVPFATNNSKNNEYIQKLEKKKEHFNISKIISSKKEEITFFSFFVNNYNLMKENLKFEEKNIKWNELISYLKKLLLNAFKLDNKKYQCKIFLAHKILNNGKLIELKINWTFQQEGSKHFYKNIKYYDNIHLYFK